jgi:transcriptional regulator with XRE-family HTH domain
MTTRGLAESLGYTIHTGSYISLIENGKKKPSFDFVVKVAQFFSITTDQLLLDDREVDEEG